MSYPYITWENTWIARSYSQDWKIWNGQIVLTFVGHKYVEEGEYYWLYVIQHSDGHLTSMIHSDALSNPGLCGECQKPTIDDYLCNQCRENLNV